MYTGPGNKQLMLITNDPVVQKVDPAADAAGDTAAATASASAI